MPSRCFNKNFGFQHVVNVCCGQLGMNSQSDTNYATLFCQLVCVHKDLLGILESLKKHLQVVQC